MKNDSEQRMSKFSGMFVLTCDRMHNGILENSDYTIDYKHQGQSCRMCVIWV